MASSRVQVSVQKITKNATELPMFTGYLRVRWRAACVKLFQMEYMAACGRPLAGTLSIRETAEQLGEWENVMRAYIDKEVTSKCEKFQFWANYPFKRRSFIFLTHRVSLAKIHKRYLSFIHFVLRQTAVISLSQTVTLKGLDQCVFGRSGFTARFSLTCIF